MPLISVYPNNGDAEDFLENNAEKVREQFKLAVHRSWDIPTHDVIVTPYECKVILGDRDASDIVILVDTNPNRTLEKRANLLRDTLAGVWLDIWKQYNLMTNIRFLRFEIWIRFLPGSWCLVTAENFVEDNVDHIV